MGGWSKRRREREALKYQDRWAGLHKTLIADLEEGGHSLEFTTHWEDKTSENRGHFITRVHCTRCFEKYRGLLWRSGKGLSPKRPCEGDSSGDNSPFGGPLPPFGRTAPTLE